MAAAYEALAKLRHGWAPCWSRSLTLRQLALTLIARGSIRLRIVVADDSDAEEFWLLHAGALEFVLIDELVAEADR